MAIFVQAAVSIKRLNAYFKQTAAGLDAHAECKGQPLEGAISIKGSPTWATSAINGGPVLVNVDLNVRAGELVAIVGPTASGKTSLLCAILGQLNGVTLDVQTAAPGRVSYAAQAPWIQNRSVRDNILLGQAYEPKRYERVVAACGLEQDLRKFEYGDMTEVGEGGSTLSGGQRARLALARAAYAQTNVYVLDDIFAAIDAQLCCVVFTELVLQELAGKTRIIATNNKAMLPYFDRIVALESGRVAFVGTYEEFYGKVGPLPVLTANPSGARPDIRQNLPARGGRHDEEPPPLPRPLVEQEVIAVGMTQTKVYVRYLLSAGGWTMIIGIAFAALSNGLTSYTSIYLSTFSSSTSELIAYTGISLSQALCTLVASVFLTLLSFGASTSLQQRALTCLMNAPISYFDTTLSGRLLNKFGRDVDIIDSMLGVNFRSFVMTAFGLLAAVVLICFGDAIMALIVLPIILAYIFLQVSLNCPRTRVQ